MKGVLLKRFETPDETRLLERGQFDVVRLGGLTVGRATYRPGWKWSEHVWPKAGASRCTGEHVGMVVSGKAAVEFADGEILLLQPGELFAIPGAPHDSWVVGDELYVSLHFLGADEYAKPSGDA